MGPIEDDIRRQLADIRRRLQRPVLIEMTEAQLAGLRHELTGAPALPEIGAREFLGLRIRIVPDAAAVTVTSQRVRHDPQEG